MHQGFADFTIGVQWIICIRQEARSKQAKAVWQNTQNAMLQTVYTCFHLVMCVVSYINTSVSSLQQRKTISLQISCWTLSWDLTTIVSLDGSWSCPEQAVGLIQNPTCGAQADNIRRSILKHSYYLTKSGICMRTFHVAQIHIHRNVSRDSDIRPTLKHLVVPLDLHCPSTCRHICQSLTLWCFSLFKKHDQRMANLCKGVSWTCCSWWNSQGCACFALREAGDKTSNPN